MHLGEMTLISAASIESCNEPRRAAASMWRLVTQGSAIQSMQGGRKLAAWDWAAEERVSEQGGTAETRTDGTFQPGRGVDGAPGAHKQVGGSVVLGERLLTMKVITAVEITP